MSTEAIRPEFLADWQAAELAAAAHLRGVGFVDAVTTSAGADGGIDVESAEAAAQVKFYATPVGRPEVQRLKGAAHDYRSAVFYSTGGYTREAIDYADRANVALFVMDGFGRCTPVSAMANLLAEPSMVGDREQRLTAIRAERYRYAGMSLRSDVALYGKYFEQAKLVPAEANAFDYVLSQLVELVRRYAEAVSELRLSDADELYRSAVPRLAFLSISAKSKLCVEKETFDHAAREGWLHDSDQTSEVQLSGAVRTLLSLFELLDSFLVGWEFILGDDFRADSLVDEQPRVFQSLLVYVTLDRAMLSDVLFDVLKLELRAQVAKSMSVAEAHYAQILTRLARLGIEDDRELTASIVRARHLADRAKAQLDAAT